MVKKLLLTICTTLCCSLLYGKQDWKLVWNDEFDYSGAPDNSKWSFDTQGNNWDWGNNEAQNYTPAENKNAWVEDGNLIIEARKEAYKWYGDGETKQYTSARLLTKGKGDWLYGKVEVKALLPTGRGMWPAIWMLSTDDTYGGWPNSGELDIMENVGFDPNKIHCNIHTEAYNHKNGTNKGNTVTTSSPSQNWHIYSMEWDAEKVIFFLDGEVVFRFNNEHKSYKEWPYDKRFHLLLNIAVGGGWGGEQGIDDGIFPQRMLVDYVRVYEYGEVEETPVDGVLSLKTSLEKETICEGDETTLTIDTTGTGKLLNPNDLKIEVIQKDEMGYTTTLDLSNAIVDNNGLIMLNVSAKSSTNYQVKASYHEQIIEKDNMLKVDMKPNVTLRVFDNVEHNCEGESVTLTATIKTYDPSGSSDNITYEWNIEQAEPSTTLTFAPKESTTVSISVSNGVCTTVSESIDITVYSRPEIASIDSIGPNDVKIVMENGFTNPPYFFYLDDENGRPREGTELYDLNIGEHSIKVVDGNGCKSEQYTFYINEPTSVEQIAGDNIAVYSTKNGIQVVGVDAGTAYQIINANGMIVAEGRLSVDNTLNASFLTPGIYYVLIEGKAYPVVLQ